VSNVFHSSSYTAGPSSRRRNGIAKGQVCVFASRPNESLNEFAVITFSECRPSREYRNDGRYSANTIRRPFYYSLCTDNTAVVSETVIRSFRIYRCLRLSVRRYRVNVCTENVPTRRTQLSRLRKPSETNGELNNSSTTLPVRSDGVPKENRRNRARSAQTLATTELIVKTRVYPYILVAYYSCSYDAFSLTFPEYNFTE